MNALQVSEFIHCSKRCFERYANVTTENGWMECENDFIWMECHRGFIPSTEESFVCQDFNAEEDKVECLPLPYFLTRMREFIEA